MPVSLATRAMQLRGIPCVDYPHLLALVTQLDSVGGRVCSQLQKSKGKMFLTVYSLQLQEECSGRVPCLCAHASFRLEIEECSYHWCSSTA